MSVQRLTRRALALLGTAAIMAPLAISASQAGESLKADGLSVNGLSGTSAVAALGRNLSSVAAQSGMTATELRRTLLRDKSLRVSGSGRLFYVEDAAQVPRKAAPSDAVLDGTLLPLAETFNLHSKPGSNRLLILNFQGKTITNTYWNSALKKPTIVATPFNYDSDPATFSDQERTAIQLIWQRVAEDFAAFDVDVTTDINALAKAPAGSAYASAVITRQGDYFVPAPGIATISTFGVGTGYYEPAFVAYDTLHRNVKYIAECISHEFGHRLGLFHDGTTTVNYYRGQGTGPMSWAPIMGAGYYSNVTQFSKGEYANANNKQDDFAVMQRFLPLRADVGGSTAGEAAGFPATASDGRSAGSINGVIETQGDVDLFRIAAGAGAFSASANGAALGPDAKLSLSLVDDAGNVLLSNPAGSSMNAAISGNIPRPGTYYLRVGATGYGVPSTNGFSDYGSRGFYRLTASYPAASETPPMASIVAAPAAGIAPLAVAFTGSASGGSGKIAASNWDFGNGSTSSSASSRTTYAQPGLYQAQLKVTDSAGFSKATSQQVMVGRALSAATLTISRTVNPDGSYGADVNVNDLADGEGNKLVPVTVYGTWSGAVQGSVQSSTYTRSGTTFHSPSARAASECFTFKLDRVDTAGPSGLSYWFTPMPRTVTACPQQASR